MNVRISCYHTSTCDTYIRFSVGVPEHYIAMISHSRYMDRLATVYCWETGKEWEDNLTSMNKQLNEYIHIWAYPVTGLINTRENQSHLEIAQNKLVNMS